MVFYFSQLESLAKPEKLKFCIIQLLMIYWLVPLLVPVQHHNPVQGNPNQPQQTFEYSVVSIIFSFIYAQ